MSKLVIKTETITYLRIDDQEEYYNSDYKLCETSEEAEGIAYSLGASTSSQVITLFIPEIGVRYIGAKSDGMRDDNGKWLESGSRFCGFVVGNIDYPW